MHESKMIHGPDGPADHHVDLQAMDSKSLLKLYQGYLVARDKSHDAESRMAEFFALLEEYDESQILSSATKKNQLRHLYMVIQPYLISSLRKLKDERFATDFDKKIIDAFAGRKTRGEVLPIRHILAVKDEILGDFSSEKTALLRRTEAIHQAIEQHVNADRVGQLLIDNPYGARSGYLVKNPQYTVYVKRFEEKLVAFTKLLFSQGIQEKLVAQNQSVTDQSISLFLKLESRTMPFPEATQGDYCAYSKQERQVLGLKRLYNCVHHLREIAIQIEELHEESYKIIYVWRVIMLEEHLRDAIILYNQLSQDEHFSVLTTDLRHSINEVIQAFRTLSMPYAPDKADKHSNLGEVRDPVFFIVNGLVIAREQIDAWQHGDYISKETAQQAQLFAEEISGKVRKIVESNSYLQWILQSGTFYHLFYELKDRWNKFAASSTNTIEANLESIYTENFTNILLEADEWERKAGLAPGFISGPLKQILDAYYAGMVEVLSHDTGHQMSLSTTLAPFDKRSEQLHLAMHTETQKISEAEKNLASVRRFATLFQEHPDTPETSERYNQFITLLSPLLSMSSFNDYVKDTIDAELLSVILLQRKPSSPEEAVKCREAVKKLVAVSEARFEGDINTARLSLTQYHAQRDYLRQELVAQEDKNKIMKRDMIKKLIREKLVDYQSGEKNLLFARKLYDDAVKGEIEAHTEAFLDGVLENQPIEKQVKAFLEEKVGAFDKVHFAEFQKYNELQRSIAELKSYLDSQNEQLTKVTSSYRHTWALESAGTLKLKLRLYESLERILAGKKTSNRYEIDDVSDEFEEGENVFDPDDQWHIKARIERFKKVVEAPRFVNALLKTEETYKISPLSWLVKWFVGLLRLLSVYKTEAEIIHEHLKITSTLSEVGMFASPKATASQVGDKPSVLPAVDKPPGV